MSTGQVPPCTSREVSLPYPASKATLLPSTLRTSGGAFAPLARPLLLPSFRDPFLPRQPRMEGAVHRLWGEHGCLWGLLFCP